jgi:BirA family transcriptional regulator, biotin operon repressor / biotin---[acetyl-CoA-carboxylase] ligase
LSDHGTPYQLSPTFENQLIELESVDSTNNYAIARIHDGTAKNGQVFLAHFQTAGKGQRGKLWHGQPGQNLSMSLVIQPGPLHLTQQFIFSAAVSLGILDYVQTAEPKDWSIKWPNDIYWRDRKAAGILIENIIQGTIWRYAVIGVGINLNQESFPSDIPNAVSIKNIIGEKLLVKETASKIIPKILEKINMLMQDPARILSEFNQSLYKKGQIVRLKKGDKVSEHIISGVNQNGLLITDQGLFNLEEVTWLL